MIKGLGTSSSRQTVAPCCACRGGQSSTSHCRGRLLLKVRCLKSPVKFLRKCTALRPRETQRGQRNPEHLFGDGSLIQACQVLIPDASVEHVELVV
jgi:hypothetical protein